jgi:potassium voltage-gated channel Eag-related subfamily H protein 8
MLLSVRYPQENGVPQGSVISVTLFAVTINGMINAVGPSVATSLYVDDISVYNSSRSIVTIELWLATGRYKPSVMVGSREWVFLLSSKKLSVCTSHA